MRRIIILTAFALAAAACGSGESASTLASLDGGGTTTPSTAVGDGGPGAPGSDYPDVVVADLAGGEVNLKELALEEEPVLLWFWAPH